MRPNLNRRKPLHARLGRGPRMRCDGGRAVPLAVERVATDPLPVVRPRLERTALIEARVRALAVSRNTEHSADLLLTRQALASAGPERDQLFERLRCVPRFVAALHRQLRGRLDEGELEDLAQSVLFGVWRKLPEYRGEAALESWAFAFCRFETLNAVRLVRRRSLHVERSESPTKAREPAVDVPVDRGLIEEDARELLAELSPREADVVRLRHFDGLDVRAIAAQLEISESSVKTHYHRGLEKLRASFAARGVTESER